MDDSKHKPDPTAPFVSLQDTFNRVATHLLTQRARSTRDEHTEPGEEICVYRNTDEGLSCAVGALIPDALYDPKWDTGVMGLNVTALPAAVRAHLIGNSEAALALLMDLQVLHDKAPERLWHARLGSLALHHGLDTSILDGFEVRP